ncbi:replication protein A subunit RPA32 [Dichomitus squalens]|uniref:Replication protein A subunit RPA32 n=1 Tax=Dichomitus squalens TaxID=114155 RepID=A0A4Q9PCX1_9APHY|nr:replication protein A subunit RPA32 [Dichomitus squalens LYAD-421 SS1]EJF65865.1 replication protein A subunit RPA32 [Dichomitus squalens LYAD-421 SS1]TBU35968.1 replication protein A subunit RPA32 [Dichomitus squalens]TBU50791.1 replication protein A subunit RPA32 [Dichomitus squalens]TBU65813.1 replication protein A subunit RPA32 [Dichomitus squalens]
MSGYDNNPFYGGGGGYMSQNSQFGSGGGSPGGSGRRAASHSLRPVSLKQLVEATIEHSDADWKIGDVEVGQVTVVAHVLSVQAQTTNCVYLLDDGTAQFEARQWVDANNEEDGSNRVADGRYVRVLGTLKMFGQKRYITATHIIEIPPERVCDELCFHIAEAAMMSIIFERGPPPRPSEGSTTSRVNGAANPTSAYSASSNTAGANSAQYAGLSQLQRQIVEFLISQPKTNEGTHVGAIARHIASLSGGAPVNADNISKALDDLSDQGHVYTTVDDSHFCISE